jgi:DNA-binding CsgD family transcriptional regulator
MSQDQHAEPGHAALRALPDDVRGRAAVRGRDLGSRVRHGTREERLVSGWRSMTATEERITELVALGMTNRQVGAELFISSHTVAFHLRQVFRKLEIRSRVELARLAAQNAQAQRSA